MTAFTETLNYIFIRLPGVDGPDFTPEMLRRFRTTKEMHGDRIEDDWVCMVLNGTTFSGQSFRTTLGNSFRAFCYAYYYCFKTDLPQLREPWSNQEICIISAGDDTSLWSSERFAGPIRRSIIANTTVDKTP